MSVDHLLKEIVGRLVEEYRPEKVILFGSYAYGHPHQESDLDLLVVKDTPEEWWDRKKKVSRIIEPARHGISVDIRVLTPSELNEELLMGNQFYQEVVSRGIHLYGEKEDYPMVEDSTPYAKAWLSVALEDLQVAENTLEQGLSANVAGALLQQAVEKYLKAYLMSKGWRLERTHDLGKLLDDALIYDPTLESFRPVCEEVTKYYVDDRYPERRRELTHQQVEASLEQVRPLIDKVLEAFQEQESL